MAGRWVDVGEAAQELGISTDAVRKRIARGSLRSDRENGSVRVWLDDGRSEAGREAQIDSEVLVESLRDQVDYLRSQLDIRTEELREHRRIIAALRTARRPRETRGGYGRTYILRACPRGAGGRRAPMVA
jgi:hypothetical protein